MRNILFLVSLCVVFFLSGCGKTEQMIGDSIPVEGVALENTGVVLPMQLSGTVVMSMPQRVKDMGFFEPNDMGLDISSSRQTFEEKDGYNSVTLVYTGLYEVAMIQAKRIADAVGIPMDKDFAMVQELIANGGDVDIDMQDAFQGVVYTNYSLTDTRVSIVTSITVEPDGRLIIDIVDYTKMNTQ